MPVDHQPLPVVQQPLPVVQQPLPVDHQPLPVDQQPLPVDHQPLPVDHQPLPVDQQPLLVDQPSASRGHGLRQQAVPVDQPGRSRVCDARQHAVPVDQPGRSRVCGARQQAGDHLHLRNRGPNSRPIVARINDAIKEGDGEKLFVHWKFLLLVFKCGECCNYSIEAVNLLYQTHASSPRLTAQLKWGRFINTHGQ